MSANDLLNSPDFESTSGDVIKIAVLKGKFIDKDKRSLNKIRREALMRGLTAPNAEVACLIREKFTDQEIRLMGLEHIEVMHRPIMDSGGVRRLLGSAANRKGFWGSHAENENYNDSMSNARCGFAFAVSEAQN